jgi:sulfur carrier protein
MPNMNIILNGSPATIQEQITLAELTHDLNLPGKRYAVEINEQLIPRSRHDEHRLKEGDNVEIVQAIGGG